MKKAFLPLFLSAISLSAQNYSVETGYFNSLPTIRSASEFGNNINIFFNENGPKNNKYKKYISYGIQSIIYWQFENCLHELGHAKVSESVGNTCLFNDKYTNWWEYLFKNNTFKNVYVRNTGYFTDRQFLNYYFAGLNAQTYFLENKGYELPKFLFYKSSLSILEYILREPEYSDFRYTNAFLGKNFKYKAAASQILCLIGTQISNTDFYTYLNFDGISVKAKRKYKDYNVSFETAIYTNNYNAEISISKKFNYKNINLKPEIVTGIRGAGYNIEISYKQFTIGYRNPNKNTLSGERELKKEYYLQYKL